MAQALNTLLAGSGVGWRFSEANTVVLEKIGPGAQAPGALQLDPVQVQGVFPVPSQAMIDNIPPPYAGGQVATGGALGVLGNRDVMDTPFNQISYTAKKAQDQQARSVRDVILDDPSVRATVADGGIGAELDQHSRLSHPEQCLELWRPVRDAADLFRRCRRWPSASRS